MTFPSVFIAGCGDIGVRTAGLWLERGVPAAGLARTPRSASRLRDRGIAPFPGDLDRPETLSGMPTAGALLYYLAPPPESGETDPRARAFAGAVPPGREPAKAVYMSTTGVYGNTGGGWVTEESPAAPETARGKRRLDAEEVFLAWGRQRGVPVVILRVAGIYGPGRIPVDRVRRGEPVQDERQSPFTNRIHADDLARVCVAAGEKGRDGAVYNVSDGAPGTITQYLYAVADRLGVPRPPALSREEAGSRLSPGLLSYLAESRRVDNRKMREELGVVLRYPTLAEGLAASLADGRDGPS